ncbi:hypothetical protein BDF22DRAFT_654327 [Syncephalis plumigaleata]|nr:hypothetical protein BDF22DRAFT_654327 [Syncephalis plumigaleata]
MVFPSQRYLAGINWFTLCNISRSSSFWFRRSKRFYRKINAKITEYPPLCVVVLPQQTLFIVSPTLLQERLSCGIQNDLELIQFVQVDRANKHPFMLDDVDHYSVFIKQFAAILDQLQQQVQRYTQYQSIVDITELVSDDMLIALTGWLLEYPAIYIQPH